MVRLSTAADPADAGNVDQLLYQRQEQLRNRVTRPLGEIGRCITEAPGNPKLVIDSMPHMPIKAGADANGAVRIEVQNPPPGTQACLDKLVANLKVPPGPVVTLTVSHVNWAGQEPPDK